MEHSAFDDKKKYLRVSRSLLTVIFFVLLFLLILIIIFAVLLANAQRSNDIGAAQTPPVSSGAMLTPIPTVLPSSSALPQTTQKNPDSTNANITADYDFSEFVKKSDSVDDRYFDDVVFIGDSRTEGLAMNIVLPNTKFYAYKGLNISSIYTKEVIKMGDKKYTVMDALKRTDYAKLYIMFGLNELGWEAEDVFISRYGKLIDDLRAINKNADIYIQLIMPLSKKYSDDHPEKYAENNTRVFLYNGLIKKMAEEKKIFCLDTHSALADENGCLPEGAASDGVHLNKSYCKKWYEFLKTHTVK
ncbi:MAG: GDSL-type esterase/lipase family protein [Clostridia bacterium]